MVQQHNPFRVTRLQGTQKCVQGETKNFVKTSIGQVYLEFDERETKTGLGNDPRNVKAIAPKKFGVPSDQNVQ